MGRRDRKPDTISVSEAQAQDETSYRLPTNFFADLNILVDIFDGKVPLEAWNGAVYPRAEFPSAVGDELISLDEKPVAKLIAEFEKYRGFGNPRDVETPSPSQAVFPDAAANAKLLP